jgi:arylsulfatase A-like enzyme
VVNSWANLSQARPGEHERLRQYMTAVYDESIRRADRAVGRILSFLQDRQLTEKTLFIVTADHGDEFLEHGGTLHTGTLFEELVHVPLIVRVPGAPRGVRRPELVRSFDVTPTILDYAGIATAARHMDARSFRPALAGGRLDEPREAYAGFPSRRMLRTDRYKLLRYRDGREALYDLVRDPGEEHDLAGSEDDGIRRVRASLAERLDKTVARLRAQGTSRSAPSGEAVDEATREQLRALGYID